MSNSSQSKLLKAVSVGLGVTVLSGLSYLYYRYLKKESIPTKWKQVGKLEEIYIFPIKSCGPIELDEGVCENLGLRKDVIKDRGLMLIEKSGQVITARTYPKMFNIRPKKISSTKLVFSAPGMKEITFDYSVFIEGAKGDEQALIYGFHLNVQDCGDYYHKWFSEYILEQSEGLRLVYYPHSTPTRPIDKDFEEGVFTKNDTGTLQDISSYHLININSVQELNSRLNNPIPPAQFRANFNIKTAGLPFAEDRWDYVRIGEEAVFRNIGPCYRCILPNINPYTAERDQDGEPLKTLKTYRKIPGAKTKSPGMGIQMGLRARGFIKRGDNVYIEDLS